MANRNLIMTLAKVIIAAAWADGTFTLEEENSLKDLLYQLPSIGKAGGLQLTTREWQLLEMYMHSPIEQAERQRLIEELQARTRSKRDKQLVFEALDRMVAADGDISDGERGIVNGVKEAINEVSTDVFTQMGKVVGFAMQRRSETAVRSFNREQYLDDFIKNKVFYGLRRRLRTEDVKLDLSEDELRTLSLAGGMMAKVAHVDKNITDDEFESMVTALQDHWDVDEKTAVFVAEVAASEVADKLDHHRTTRQFATRTEPEARKRFLDVLFAVADSDGHVTYDEIEEIREIARSLHLYDEDFIAAKVKIPRERRDT